MKRLMFVAVLMIVGLLVGCATSDQRQFGQPGKPRPISPDVNYYYPNLSQNAGR